MRKFIVKLILALALIDVTGDFMIVLSENVAEILSPIRTSLGIIIPVVIFLGLFDSIKAEKRLIRVLIGFVAILIPALLNGILFNNPSNAFREIVPFVFLLLCPILIKITDDEFQSVMNFFLWTLLIVGVIKLIAAQIVSLIVQGILSWKVILRMSPLFIYGYTFYLQKYLNFPASKIKNIVATIIFLILILSAQARALNFALLVCTLYLIGISNFKLHKVLPFGIAVVAAAILTTIITDYEFSQIFGRWEGENYDDAVDYRKEQLDILINRFIDHPIFGVGLGYFTPGYRTYDELDNPFLLELDTLNFLTKIGIFGDILYFFIIIYIFRIKYKNKSDYNKRIIFNSARYTIIGMYLYSTFQTLHSSVLFWMVMSLCIATILRYSKIHDDQI